MDTPDKFLCFDSPQLHKTNDRQRGLIFQASLSFQASPTGDGKGLRLLRKPPQPELGTSLDRRDRTQRRPFGGDRVSATENLTASLNSTVEISITYVEVGNRPNPVPDQTNPDPTFGKFFNDHGSFNSTGTGVKENHVRIRGHNLCP